MSIHVRICTKMHTHEKIKIAEHQARLYQLVNESTVGLASMLPERP